MGVPLFQETPIWSNISDDITMSLIVQSTNGCEIDATKTVFWVTIQIFVCLKIGLGYSKIGGVRFSKYDPFNSQ